MHSDPFKEIEQLLRKKIDRKMSLFLLDSILSPDYLEVHVRMSQDHLLGRGGRKMTVEKLVKKKPYITLETNASETGSDTLSDSEWSVIETLFVKHPNLVKIWAPYRDPELME